MKRFAVFIFVPVLASLACGQSVTVTPAALPSIVAPAAQPSASNPDLWYVTRGEAKMDQLWGVDVDSQGNIYTAGLFQSPPTKPFFDVVVYKFAPDGTELWRTQWGDQFQEKAFIVTVSEPYVFVGGEANNSFSLLDSKMLLLALDVNDGHVIWKFDWGSGTGYHELDGLVVDGDSIFVSGWTSNETTGGDIAILKLDRADGKLAWVKTWGSDGFDSADGQMVVDDQFIYVSGRYNGAMLTGGKSLLVKFSKGTGEYVSHTTWGQGIFNDGYGMTSDGTNLYVVGLTIVNANGQIFLLKYDKDLKLIWEQTWGGKGGESARAVEVDGAGNILVTGHTESYGAGKNDIMLLKFSPDGTLLWEKIWGGKLLDQTHGLVIDGNFVYLVGETENNAAGLADGLLIKADARTGEFPQP
jgi:hypothetical protein